MAQAIVNSSIYNFSGRDYLSVPAELTFADTLGSWRCRWGVGRMKYLIEPGIYAVGNPTADSHVLVTANYKMTFDRLRQELGGIDCWILVIDTKGINVWCAAGKGTFGTDEIVRCVDEFKLSEIVSHKKLVVPQLGAPAVSAYKVKEKCGFSVTYGPVRAADIPAFLDAGMKATDQMRTVKFPLRDRVVLIPIDVLMWSKPVLAIIMFLFLVGGFGRSGFSFYACSQTGLLSAGLFLFAYICAGILGPLLLPFLPGRAFSLKGLWIGLAFAAALGLSGFGRQRGMIFTGAWMLIIPAVTSFMVMNFTGTSTYTSMSGVEKEMKIAVPMQFAAVVIGTVLWIVSLFLYP